MKSHSDVALASRPAYKHAAGVDAASTPGLETSATFFDGAHGLPEEHSDEAPNGSRGGGICSFFFGFSRIVPLRRKLWVLAWRNAEF
jgi:hypothetical protein